MRPDRVQIYQTRRAGLGRKQYRARVVGPNGKVLFVSAEGYNNRSDLLGICVRLFPDLEQRDEGDSL
jgi:hypothetical protein